MTWNLKNTVNVCRMSDESIERGGRTNRKPANRFLPLDCALFPALLRARPGGRCFRHVLRKGRPAAYAHQTVLPRNKFFVE